MEMTCILPHNFEGKLELNLKIRQRMKIIYSGVQAVPTVRRCCAASSSCFARLGMALKPHFHLLLQTQELVVADD